MRRVCRGRRGATRGRRCSRVRARKRLQRLVSYAINPSIARLAVAFDQTGDPDHRSGFMTDVTLGGWPASPSGPARPGLPFRPRRAPQLDVRPPAPVRLVAPTAPPAPPPPPLPPRPPALKTVTRSANHGEP